MNKAAVFGGTFDPVHYGHLLIAEQVLNNFSLEKVIFMPASNPPHKSEELISPSEHRVEMLKIAVEDNPHFEISRYELEKKGPSYTAYTLKYLLEEKLYDRVYFIIGADSLLDIFNWKKPEFLLSEGHFIVAPRPGYPVENILADSRYKPYRDHINLVDTIKIDLSSSDIRRAVRQGQSIRYKTSAKVIAYINENMLYRGDNDAREDT